MLRRFPDEVRALRSKGAERVGLVVVIDGDNRGARKRKEELAQALSAAGLSPVGPKERIAICVPTWSIETWLFALSGTATVGESRSYKRDWQKLSDTRGMMRAAVAAWQAGRTPVELPSFRDACAELERLSRGEVLHRGAPSEEVTELGSASSSRQACFARH